METTKPLIGVIGQGWVGGSYATNFEKRGFRVVRYGLEPQYVGNRDQIAECDIVFIAVPTPTTPRGFDDSIVRGVLPLVGPGKIGVIKSTVLPGLTKRLQKEFSDIVLLISPEFLSEATAEYDATHPFSNIVGLPVDSPKHAKAAELVHGILPNAPFATTVMSDQAELIKYYHNVSGVFQILLSNLMYDHAQSLGVSWEPIGEALRADPFISNRYSKPVHKSGRGAGGACFIKDVEAYAQSYLEACGRLDHEGVAFLMCAIDKNNRLLIDSGKDLDLLSGVYGPEVLGAAVKKTGTE